MRINRFGNGLASFLAAILWVVLIGQGAQAAEKLQWFRGQLHAHTYWSDGRGFPEQAADAYKQRGFQFLCITDHNRFAEDKDVWREVAAGEGAWPGNVTQAIFDKYVQAFGKEWVESRSEDKNGRAVTSVRLKTNAEVKERLEEPGKFIMLPGVGLTQKVNDLNLHLNYINLPGILPCIKGAELIKKIKKGSTTVSGLIGLNASEVREAAGVPQKPHMLILNHPAWVHYDVTPQDLIDHPEILFFEVCNGGAKYVPHPRVPNYTETFWDVVNAFRQLQGQPLLYGIGSDDAHFYDEARINKESGVGHAWVMVRAADLTPEHLLAAMHRGEFYASSGVLLDDVSFSQADSTLRVKVEAEEGVKYRIEFVTTKKYFDRTMNEMASPAKGKLPARKIPVYSNDIGRIAQTVTGTEAMYRLEADDLYVRARVISDSPNNIAHHTPARVKMAWTQPYTAKATSSEKPSVEETK